VAARRTRGRTIGLGLGLSLAALGACQPRATPESNDQATADAIEGRYPDGSSPRSTADRIPRLTGAPVGMQPGYVEGSFAYASVRAGAAPLELLGVDADARISLSARALNHAAVHVRVHVPVAAPARFEAGLAQVLADSLPGWETFREGAPSCAGLGPSVVCAGDGARVLVVRAVPGAFVADLLIDLSGNLDDHAQINEAVTRPTASSPAILAGQRGDATLLIDGPRAVAAMAMAMAMTNDALVRLHETERIFEGVSVEASFDDDRLVATVKWLVSETGRARLSEVFELSPVDADVPSLAGLCAGAIACGRSRGLPASERFAGLATGVYADPTQLRTLLERDRAGLAVLALETWPNAIASLTRVPRRFVNPPESLIVPNAVAVAERALGFGFSVRPAPSQAAAWVAYARMSGADISTVQGFVQLSHSTLSPTSIIGQLPGRAYTIIDPSEGAGDWGWTVLASDDDQLAWLAGLPHDDGAVPIVYFEAADLWQVLAWDPGLSRDLGLAKAWLSKRSVRVQLTLGADRAPELRLALIPLYAGSAK